eukprot:CAMPEP_0184484776 /NCGR_PEP_ID=MMETSP0113_2-20130426/6451_1 /TAXON_ID=91329 /ORGANISM="Norrisiella sphaerica, Strain BC52" /LENGTH=797 /DNA_ID=CAMNT_0026865907 /DNA_START=1824 /DNA_END=4217 /DNA_ORIENTATION=+
MPSVDEIPNELIERIVKAAIEDQQAENRKRIEKIKKLPLYVFSPEAYCDQGKGTSIDNVPSSKIADALGLHTEKGFLHLHIKVAQMTSKTNSDPACSFSTLLPDIEKELNLRSASATEEPKCDVYHIKTITGGQLQAAKQKDQSQEKVFAQESAASERSESKKIPSDTVRSNTWQCLWKVPLTSLTAPLSKAFLSAPSSSLKFLIARSLHFSDHKKVISSSKRSTKEIMQSKSGLARGFILTYLPPDLPCAPLYIGILPLESVLAARNLANYVEEILKAKSFVSEETGELSSYSLISDGQGSYTASQLDPDFHISIDLPGSVICFCPQSVPAEKVLQHYHRLKNTVSLQLASLDLPKPLRPFPIHLRVTKMEQIAGIVPKVELQLTRHLLLQTGVKLLSKDDKETSSNEIGTIRFSEKSEILKKKSFRIVVIGCDPIRLMPRRSRRYTAQKNDMERRETVANVCTTMGIKLWRLFYTLEPINSGDGGAYTGDAKMTIPVSSTGTDFTRKVSVVWLGEGGPGATEEFINVLFHNNDVTNHIEITADDVKVKLGKMLKRLPSTSTGERPKETGFGGKQASLWLFYIRRSRIVCELRGKLKDVLPTALNGEWPAIYAQFAEEGFEGQFPGHNFQSYNLSNEGSKISMGTEQQDKMVSVCHLRKYKTSGKFETFGRPFVYRISSASTVKDLLKDLKKKLKRQFITSDKWRFLLLRGGVYLPLATDSRSPFLSMHELKPTDQLGILHNEIRESRNANLIRGASKAKMSLSQRREVGVVIRSAKESDSLGEQVKSDAACLSNL